MALSTDDNDRWLSNTASRASWMFGLSIERPILDHHPKAHIHEIRRISWNPWNPGGFHPWNPADFMKSMKSGRFHPSWNLVDYTHEIWQISPRYHLWNPPKIIKASVSAKTLQFDECRVGAMTKDFTHEIHQISPRFHLWNPPKIIKAVFQQKLFSLMNAR